MQRNRFFTIGELLPSALFIAIAAYFSLQIAIGIFSNFATVSSGAGVAEIASMLTLAGLGVVLWKLPNLAWARFFYGIFALGVSYLIVRGDTLLELAATSGLKFRVWSFHLTAVDASVLSAFCVLCVWLNLHRWIIWNLRYPRRRPFE